MEALQGVPSWPYPSSGHSQWDEAAALESKRCQVQRARTSLWEGPTPLCSTQAHRGDLSAGFHNQLNGAETRLLKYPTGSFECFQILLMPSAT